jgi:hypothetical protein
MEKYPILTIPPQTFGVEIKRHGKVEGFHYIQLVSYNGEMTYRAEIPKLRFSRCFADVNLAAKAVDLKLAQSGRYPVNNTLTKKI